MNRKSDLLFVRCLLISSLILAFIVSFWLIFDIIKIYQKINYEIEDYLSKTLSTNKTEFIFDETLDELLDQSNAKLNTFCLIDSKFNKNCKTYNKFF